MKLALADELSGGRQWKGTYHLVAVYSRSLAAKEVLQNYQAGTKGKTEALVAKVDPNIEVFETKVAAILSNHCLECHDASTRKGKLDLSTMAGAKFHEVSRGPTPLS